MSVDECIKKRMRSLIYYFRRAWAGSGEADLGEADLGEADSGEAEPENWTRAKWGFKSFLKDAMFVKVANFMS